MKYRWSMYNMVVKMANLDPRVESRGRESLHCTENPGDHLMALESQS